MTAANLDLATGHNIAIAATDLHTTIPATQHSAPGTWRQHTWSPPAPCIQYTGGPCQQAGDIE